MPRIFDFGGREVERAQTVAGLRALKNSGKQAAQVTAETADEAAAAEAAGVEMVVCRAANIGRVREGSQRVFVTAALGFAEAVTPDENSARRVRGDHRRRRRRVDQPQQ